MSALSLADAEAGVANNSSFSNNRIPLLQEAWDSTSLGAFKTCPFKYLLSIVFGYSSNRKDALVFGIAFHEAMQKYHYTRASGSSHDQGIKTALIAAIKSFVEPDESDSPVPYQALSSERNLYSLLRAVVWHLDHFTDNGFQEDSCKTFILSNGLPAAELSFRFSPELNLPSGFNQILLCGHLDHVVEHQGTLYIKDYKTTKSLSANFFDQFNPDNQMTLYTLAGNVVFDLPVRGVIIDGVQLGVHFARFQRGYSNRTQEQLECWLADTEFYLHQAHTCASRGHWPQNDKACNMYGGCEFRKVCQAPFSLHKTILDSSFTKRVWNPLQTREA